MKSQPHKYPHSDKRGRRSTARPDLNLTALAEEVGVGPDHLSKIFRGIGNPSLTLALKLANAMHIGIAQLTEQLLEARDQHEILKQAARKKKLKAKKPQPDGEDGEQDEHERLAG